MAESGKAPLSALPADNEAPHSKGNINQETTESQPVEKFCLAKALWPHVQARMTAILNNEPEQKVRS